MILSATLSKPTSLAIVENECGKPFEKIKIRLENSSNGSNYFAECFTKTQVFHQRFTEKEFEIFLNKNRGITFKNCVVKTETEEITYLTNKKGKTTEIRKQISKNCGILKQIQNGKVAFQSERGISKKNYLLPEGTPIPFLVLLGVMNSDGKVINARYDKFRQINRFLEFINDVLDNLKQERAKNGESNQPIKIVDFGCGKSYLTFAVHYFLTVIKNLPCEIEGLDLKKDVINYCNEMAQKLNLKGLHFTTGDISDYESEKSPDIIITLHACDTATDFALKYAVSKGAKVILSVPCCQHEVNSQLQKNKSNKVEISQDFSPLLKWGIIREKFSSLVTDALRGEWLESQGYNVQMLEFIDEEHTPKNILIRAVKKNAPHKNDDKPKLMESLEILPEIWK